MRARRVGGIKVTESVSDQSSQIDFNAGIASPGHTHQFEQKILALTPITVFSNYGASEPVLSVYKIGNFVQFLGIVKSVAGATPHQICQVPEEFLPEISKLPYTFVTTAFASGLGTTTGVRIILETTGILRVPAVAGAPYDYLFMDRVKYVAK